MSSEEDSACADGAEGSGRAAALPEHPGATDPWAGRTVAGRYLLEGQLGVGTVARTLRGRREGDGSPVVIKLACDVRTNESLARRMARQADAVSKLDHPHIARVLEHGVDDREGPFVTREFIEGEDLSHAVARGVLTPRRIGELLIQVLSALSEAHRHGVLHGNLKPQNVLIYRDPEQRECVKLCDFGDLGDLASGAYYRAPEQGHGTKAVDSHADVYAVGVLLYELLTEHVPFRGASVEETLALHAHEPVVPPRRLRPDRPLPTELEVVCLKALAKEPSERHRSPRAMSQALRAVISLLGARADEPLGSTVFAGDGRNVAPAASLERMTMPGEQLRSRTKFWVGAALLAAVCIAVLFGSEEKQERLPLQRESDGERTLPPFITGSLEQVDEGKQALASGLSHLRAGDAQRALPQLRAAREALGDTPEVLRALGEALVVQGSSREGVALLEQYLELEPTARDRKFVESLIRQGAQQ
jgi:serine/threonine-protein kinase